MDKFLQDFRSRLSRVTGKRYLRFAIVSIIFVAWVAWLGNWWVLPWWLLLFDIYITGYIPFSWWKKSESALVRSVMSWVDAIIYALVLVYFVFAFIGQNYQIPSSSLEKTLLTGDYLWVNKMAYGPRVPMTPVHFPLVQNTLPFLNCKSYLDKPQWEYHRLRGMGSVQLGDIVVFNFPAGDSIAVKEQNPDIYSLSRMIGEQMLAYGVVPPLDSVTDSKPIERDMAVRALGMDYIRQQPEQFGELMWRPVDRRENYVKRAVGLPGKLFEIRNREIYNDGVKMPTPQYVQFRYDIAIKGWEQMSAAQRDAFWNDLGVSKADRVSEDGHSMPIPPLTAEAVAKLKRDPRLISLKVHEFTSADNLLFPLATANLQGWTLDNYGPLRIPAKGMTVELNDSTWAIYGHAIQHYENVAATWHDGRAWLDGKPLKQYTFKMDYYFMMGDNRHSSLDSRFWGFVPEDHIVGRPVRVLLSIDPDGTGIRWNRILRKANPDK
jgi:signal peptidase I